MTSRNTGGQAGHTPCYGPEELAEQLELMAQGRDAGRSAHVVLRDAVEALQDVATLDIQRTRALDSLAAAERERDQLREALRHCVDLLVGTYGDQDGDDFEELRDRYPGQYRVIDAARAALRSGGGK